MQSSAQIPDHQDTWALPTSHTVTICTQMNVEGDIPIVRPSCPKILIWEILDRPPTFENHFLSTLHLLSKMIWSLFSFFRRNSMPAILGSYSKDLNMRGIILKSLSKKGNPNGMTTWISWLKDISLRFSSFFAEPNLICLVFCESFAKSAITWASV